MYDYISGIIAELSPTEAVIDNNGIGYKILISLQTYTKIQNSKEVKLYIYHHIREDEEALYGFSDKDERYTFSLLITVSGIGPNTARMMLSSLSTEEVCTAITSGDVNKIKSVKGIGLKTAQKVIIDLKEKVGKGSSDSSSVLNVSSNSSRGEAASALILLGFNKANVDKALDAILKKEPDSSLEDLIKKSLKLL